MPGLNNNSANLGSFCRSIGIIYDRTTPGTEPICSTFLVSEKKSASLASLLLPFAQNPEALRITFPHAEREFGVSNIHYHPQFDRNLKKEALFQGTLGNGPEAALQKYNCCVLDLSDTLQKISDAQIEQVSQSLRYPLNLTDEGFRGSLAEIELPLVIQTLNNAKKQGILYICDDMHRPLAQIYCQDGRIIAAKYRSLTNETAIFQIVEKRLSGRFIFRACKPPAWLPTQTIGRTTDTILIEAMRRQDEIANLRQQLAVNDYFMVRAYKTLYLDGISHENRQAAEMIWRALDGTTQADQLWCLVPLDDHTIFSALLEMYVSNQCMRVPLSGTMQFAVPKMPTEEAYAPAFWTANPLPLGTLMQLNAFDTISSVSLDPTTAKPRVKVGALLGAIDPYDAEHLLHDIPLLPWASGSPLIKDDLVIGMHCGVVPTSSAMDNPFGVLQQMLWCDAIAQVLATIPGTVIPPPIPLSATEPASTSASLADSGSAAAASAFASASAPASTESSTSNEPNAPNTQQAPLAGTPPVAAGSASTMSGISAASSQSDGIDQSQFDSSRRRAAISRTSPTVSIPQGPPGCREIASLKCAICGERTFSSARRCMRCLNDFVPQLKPKPTPKHFDLVIPVAAVLLVAMVASAALALSRLPTPVYANVSLVSIPKQPWVDAIVETGKKVQQPNGSFVAVCTPVPDGAKLALKTFVHLRCKANKGCTLRLLYKGSEGACLFKLDPDNPAQGQSVTYPPTATIVGPKDAPLNLLEISGLPGADEFIVIASTNNNDGFPMLIQSDQLNEVFDKADGMLKLARSKNGILVFGSQLMPTNTGSGTHNAAEDSQYFITSATVYH